MMQVKPIDHKLLLSPNNQSKHAPTNKKIQIKETQPFIASTNMFPIKDIPLAVKAIL